MDALEDNCCRAIEFKMTCQYIVTARAHTILQTPALYVCVCQCFGFTCGANIVINILTSNIYKYIYLSRWILYINIVIYTPCFHFFFIALFCWCCRSYGFFIQFLNILNVIIFDFFISTKDFFNK